MRLGIATLIVSAAVWCGGCAAVRAPPAEFPGDHAEAALDAAIAELALQNRVIDATVACNARRPAGALGVSSCKASAELELERPELRDLRRERHALHLNTPEHYARIARKLELAIVRSSPRTRARRKLLGWLAIAYHRRRQVEHARGSPCLVHYLTLVTDELRPGKARTAARYLLGLELELENESERALAQYRAIADEAVVSVGLTGAHAALGDAAFRSAVCEPSALAEAHAHYLAAAHGPTPRAVPLAGYARLRLAQVELRLGALGPALRQIELAENDGVYPDSTFWHGSNRDAVRTLLERTLRELTIRAIRDGTLRLMLAFEPPGATLCSELVRLAAGERSYRIDPQIRGALQGECSWFVDAGRRCVATAGCAQ